MGVAVAGKLLSAERGVRQVQRSEILNKGNLQINEEFRKMV
jgi:hypothetical protein